MLLKCLCLLDELVKEKENKNENFIFNHISTTFLCTTCDHVDFSTGLCAYTA